MFYAMLNCIANVSVTQSMYLPSQNVVTEFMAVESYGGLFGESANLQSYKYSGKELETMNGLNTYDFHARPYYYPAIIFHSPDILSEKTPWLSPYLYCAGNPIMLIDPTGMDTVNISRNGNIYEVFNGGNDVINVIDPLPEVIVSASRQTEKETSIVNTTATLVLVALTVDDVTGFGVLDDPAIPIIIGLVGIYNNFNQKIVFML